MGFEVDILEREESYKRRISRMVTLIGVVVLLAVGGGYFALHRQAKNLSKAEQTAAEMKVQAEIAALRAAYSADSASAHTRFSEFMDKYKAEKIQGMSIFLIALPSGRSVGSFIEEVWDDYSRTVQPGITEAAKIDMFRLHYIDAMNLAWYNSKGNIEWKGEQRPTAILLPEIKFKLTEVEMQKTTFPQVARAQIDAGIKVPKEGDPEGSDGMSPADSDSLQAESLDETAAVP